MIALIWTFLRSINPRIYLGIGLCIATLYGWHTIKLRYIEQGKAVVYLEWKIADAEREEKANDARIAEQQKQAAIIQFVRKENANEIAKIHAGYATANRLRVPATICNQFAGSGKGTSSSGSNAATTGTIALPPEIEQSLYDLAQEADTMLANYRALQEFVKQNGLAP